MYSCKVWAKFSSISNRKQIPYYSRNIPVDINGRLDDQCVCGIPFSKTWAALHAIVFHHWLSASVWGGLQMTQQHSAREVERMSHSPVCVCVWQTERLRTNECTALCCRSTVFFLHLCRTLTTSGRALLPTNSAVTSVTHERPLPSQPVCVRASQSTDAFQVNERLCVCDHTPYLSVITVSAFLLLIHHSSLPHFAKAILAMEIAFGKIQCVQTAGLHNLLLCCLVPNKVKENTNTSLCFSSDQMSACPGHVCARRTRLPGQTANL